MSLYNLLFGQNPNSDILLALLGLREHEVERFRDCGIDFDEREISIYTRTGGNNRDEWPNGKLTTSPLYLRGEDDDFDCTFRTFYFSWPEDVKVETLRDPGETGVDATVVKRVREILQREPTDGDKRSALARDQSKTVESCRRYNNAYVFNGHTVVPASDSGMESLLNCMEKADGEFYPYWSVLPLNLSAKSRKDAVLDVDTDWEIDEAAWTRYQEKFSEKYPKAIAKVREEVERILERGSRGEKNAVVIGG